LQEGFASGGSVLEFTFARPPVVDEEEVTAMRGATGGEANEQGTVRLEVYKYAIAGTTGTHRLAEATNVQNVPRMSAEFTSSHKKKMSSGLAATGGKSLQGSTVLFVHDKYHRIETVCSIVLRYYTRCCFPSPTCFSAGLTFSACLQFYSTAQS